MRSFPAEMEYGPYSTDEREAAPYTLPDPLRTPEGKMLSSAFEWMNGQRDRILRLLKKYEYGEVLPRPDQMSFQLLNRKEDALNGTAVRKEIRITCAMNDGRSHSFILLLYVPKGKMKPVPAFLGLNFKGNHNTTREEDVIPTGYAKGELLVPERSVQHSRWIPEELVARGYATGTVCYHDIIPDYAGSEPESIFRLFFEPEEYPQIRDRYSVIGGWAWGLSRAMDYLERDPDIDSSRVAVHGHSRLGKTSLWAGAVDPRFRLVISNDSGCGGGALHKRKIGENLSQHFEYHLRGGVPVWFVSETEKFIFREEALPIDQHELLAMIAPRPLAIGTATEDLSADPKGEFLACKAASAVWKLFGSRGLTAPEMPKADEPWSGDVSFHLRTGKHDQTPQDWAHYLDLADRYL